MYVNLMFTFCSSPPPWPPHICVNNPHAKSQNGQQAKLCHVFEKPTTKNITVQAVDISGYEDDGKCHYHLLREFSMYSRQ